MVDLHNRGDSVGPIMFQIGESLVYDDHHKFCYFGWRDYNVEICEAVELAKKFHDMCCNKTRIAVDTWNLCAKFIGIMRDIRRVIGEMVWQTRKEGLYSLHSFDDNNKCHH